MLAEGLRFEEGPFSTNVQILRANPHYRESLEALPALFLRLTDGIFKKIDTFPVGGADADCFRRAVFGTGNKRTLPFQVNLIENQQLRNIFSSDFF